MRYADGTELAFPEWRERAQKGRANIKATRSRFVVSEVKLEGDVADATYAESHEMTVNSPQDATDHAIHYDGEWRATLERTESGWRIKRLVELRRRVTQDGAVIDEYPKPGP